jgi:glycosyltransferase involved in cell wall biosynthesis
MRFFVTDLIGGDSNPPAPTSPVLNAPLQNIRLESLLRPFLEQSAPPRSIVAVGCNRILGINGQGSDLAIITREPIRLAERSPGGEHAYALDRLARQAREVSGPPSGNDLLLLRADMLNEMMTPLTQDFSFRAMAVLLPPSPSQPSGENAWRIRRSLFDRGLICVGSAHVGGSKALCFLASDAVRSFSQLDVEPRGHISMSVLVEGAGFANQLFRYACAKLYALRHGLTAAFPTWEGNQLFGMNDKSCVGLSLPQVSFPGFADDDRQLWEKDDPPINIDLVGYFQEIPECWRRHRPLLRRLFQLPPQYLHAIDAWRHDVTDGGRRTLVAIHVRRGDYRNLQLNNAPWFRIVPEDWYLDWLRTIWPMLSQPILFVATDEPETIVPLFREFELLSASFYSKATALPDYVRDFEIMRRADYLAICNSSFSRMAAILAPDTQKCFLPSFRSQSFAPYEPWIDPAFWLRFEDSWRGTRRRSKRQHQDTSTASTKDASDAALDQATIFFDVSDLVSYLLDHATLSGIQRVQCEILLNLVEISLTQPVRLVVLHKGARLVAIETDALLDIIEDIRYGATPRAEIEFELRAVLKRASPCTVRPRDIFLTIGAFWGMPGIGVLMQEFKNSGVIIGVFIHDVIPMTAPEYFEARANRVHVKGVIEALTFADFILTTTEFNKRSLAEHLASRKLDPLPVHLVPLGHQFALSAPTESKLSNIVGGILETEYVLCVGTIEARKNPTYLFNIWKMMVRSGRSNIPSLVFVGRKGWLVQDFMHQLQACNYLGGRILLVHDVTDIELDLLYRKCVLTMFPSFVEGWGLPVGESLAHGKICLCAAAGGVPEVGGDLADYLDPYNAYDGLEQLSRYLDDPCLRRDREREISEHFKPRSWRKVAEDLLTSTGALARQVRPFEGIAAITLPPDRYLPISSDAAAKLMDGMDGTLSAELICISGWNPPEVSGVRAAQPTTRIRFRADAPVGTRINLLMRLAADNRDFRIRICSGSGTETEVLLASGSEKLVVLSCDVEPGKLITARLSLVGEPLDGGEFSGRSYWTLKGILYFDPKHIAGEALTHLNRPAYRRSAKKKFTHSQAAPSSLTPPASGDRILLRPAAMNDSGRATSFGAFLQTPDSFWPSDFKSDRDAPIFANRADRQAFYSACGNSALAPQVGRITDSKKLMRRSNQFVSMSRFSEGSLFDRSGVWRAYGYLHASPEGMAPWLTNQPDGICVAEESLAAAPYYEHSYLFFYNGNLHNYYHWVVEGLLCLDILWRVLGHDLSPKILLPKSMDIDAVFDHRDTLRAVGLGGYDVVEVAANLIRVQEAFWVEDDLIQTMPSPYLKDFRQRVAALHSGLRKPRKRRLLVARKGPTRTIHNIEQVQDFLSTYDFETVYLEGMSMVDQILLFQGAQFIISPHGAGLANLLFCEAGTKVIELAPAAEMRPFFWMISEKLDLVHGMQFCAPVAGQEFQAAIIVDISKLEALIRMVDAHL